MLRILSSVAGEILIPIGIVAGIALLFGVILSVAAVKLKVTEDPKIDLVKSNLSGANCGGCGYAGCADFAKALVAGKAKLDLCNATPAEKKADIAKILGAHSVVADTKMVVCCQGGSNTKNKYQYQGYGNCKTMELLAGGYKACAYGCLGLGNCESVCHYRAVKVGKESYATIDRTACVKCGMCKSECPKRLFQLIPKKAKVYVACSNKEKGKDVRAICANGCIGCGLCQKVCPERAITLADNLPKFDYDKCAACGLCAEKCPTGAIRKID